MSRDRRARVRRRESRRSWFRRRTGRQGAGRETRTCGTASRRRANGASPDPDDDAAARRVQTRRHMVTHPAPSTGVIGVLTVDDHPGFLETARVLIRATPGFETVAEATSGERAVTLARIIRPHLILLDVHMPGIGGIEA